ncbi:MAG: hypothetical protein KKC79_10525 [Gammaproteobacteria bacterium]|nr:hypothetical protein [Gammaproteobacteria bacterium]MBU1444428.1 hypothetical protein [Gammaproteobacteria bacterium]MBU2287459.1 hypothetical protein [Gammaproteobacteria bacterium]MBU2409065.1 hypothetical protein [Gammaproteobacteria bacterium]
MKRILLSLVAACFTLAAGSSFAQAPAHPHHAVQKHAKKHHVKHVKHAKHKAMKRHVAAKRAIKSAA